MQKSRSMTRVAAVLATCLLAAVGSLVAASPAQAAPTCDNKGQKWVAVSSVAKPRKLTHHERYYNGTGSTMTTTFSATRQTQLSATVTLSTGVTVEASAVIGKLAATAGVSLATSGSVTSSTSVSVSAQLPHGKYLVAYRGNVEVSGNYTYYECNNSGTLFTRGTGKGKSFGTNETGAQRCDLSAPSGSTAALAKSTRC